MKTIGLVGGTGWLSSIEYYRIINEETHQILGGYQFSKCVLYSLNFGEIMAFNKRNDPEGAYPIVLDAAEKLVRIGADCIVLCANTLHKFADQLEEVIPVPLIHIAEATADEIVKQKINKVGLIGTKYTMEMDFYKSRLKNRGIESVVPNTQDRNYLHDMIFNELVKGIINKKSKERLISVIGKLEEDGIEGIILGCTEFPLVLRDEKIGLPAFDTTDIHAKAAVNFALNNI